MSAFDLTGIVKECWAIRKGNGDEGPFSTALKITVMFDQIPMKHVRINFYKEWAIRCQFLAPGDKVTLSGCKELLREINPEEEKEHRCCIDLRENESLFIRVSIQLSYHQNNSHLCQLISVSYNRF
jgi:hypothetical protein